MLLECQLGMGTQGNQTGGGHLLDGYPGSLTAGHICCQAWGTVEHIVLIFVEGCNLYAFGVLAGLGHSRSPDWWKAFAG